MKKRVNLLFILIFCVFILTLTFVSASLFSDFFNKLSGKSVDNEDQDLMQESVTSEELKDSLPTPEPKVTIKTPEESLEVQEDQLEEEIIEVLEEETDGTFEEENIGVILETPETITPTNTEANNFQSSQQRKDYTKNYQGYLIEFEKKPIAVKKLELDQKQERRGKNFFFRIFGRVILTGNTVQEDLEEYKQSLRQDNQKVKQRISQKLSEQGKILEIINEHEVLFNGIFVDFSDSEAKLIENVKGVKKIHKNLKVQTTLMDSVPLINADDVWDLNKDLQPCDPNAQNLGQKSPLTGDTISPTTYTNLEGTCLTGKNISIAILDTGIDYTHPDLGGCFGENCKVKGGYDFVNNDSNPMDDHGHGTHCAGIAAGKGILNGVAPDANLYAYKVLNSGGSGSRNQVIAGIERAIDPNQDGNFEDHLDIISMSLGGECGGDYNEFCGPEDLVSSVVDNAVNIGSVIIIAAGNSGPSESTIESPGVAKKAITVGASDKQNDPAIFSSRGPLLFKNENNLPISLIKPDVIAPGIEICSSQFENAWQQFECIDDEHTAISGTSMATPHVAGLVALLKQKNPDFNADEFKMILRNNAIEISEDFLFQGYGRIDSLLVISADKPCISEINTGGYLVSGNSDIYGTAKGESFTNYSLFYSDSLSGNFIKLVDSFSQKENELIYSFDTSSFEEGERIFLKLEVNNELTTTESFNFIDIRNTHIKFPSTLSNYNFRFQKKPSIFSIGDQVEINGTATGPNFEFFEISYCPREDPSNCIDNGIVLVGNGNIPIIEENLASWQIPTYLEAGFYNLKLKNKYNGKEYVYTSIIYIETDFQEGFPIEGFNETSGDFSFYVSDAIVVEDLNKNGKKEMIFNYGNLISVVDYQGNFLEGWPIDVNQFTPGEIIYFSPSVGDLNKDGFKEIIALGGTGTIYVFDYQGNFLFNPQTYGYANFKSPVIQDLDKNGKLDMIWIYGRDYNSGEKNKLVAIDFNGEYLEGFPIYLEKPSQFSEYYLSSFPISSVTDLDKDGSKEIIVTSFLEKNGIKSSLIWILNNKGEVLEGWPIHFEESFIVQTQGSDFVFSNMDSDEDLEIIFSMNNNKIYIINKDGTNVPNWPVEINTNIVSDFRVAISTGDINLDGNPEIFITYNAYFPNSAYYGGCLNILDKNGIVFANFPVCFFDPFIFKSGFGGVPVLANLDQDPEMEIIPPPSTSLYINKLIAIYALNQDGSIVSKFPKYLNSLIGGVKSFTVEDLDNDGDSELICPTWRQSIFVYDLPGEESNVWPQKYKDSRYTATYTFCQDGSGSGECSVSQPLFCDMGVLINNCQECGCLENQYCLSNGACSIVALKNNPSQR